MAGVEIYPRPYYEISTSKIHNTLICYPHDKPTKEINWNLANLARDTVTVNVLSSYRSLLTLSTPQHALQFFLPIVQLWGSFLLYL